VFGPAAPEIIEDSADKTYKTTSPNSGTMHIPIVRNGDGFACGACVHSIATHGATMNINTTGYPKIIAT
jgi:hypothetical protein